MATYKIDEINRMYGWFVVIVGALWLLRMLYDHLVQETGLTTDVASLIILVVGYYIVKYLTKQSR